MNATGGPPPGGGGGRLRGPKPVKDFFIIFCLHPFWENAVPLKLIAQAEGRRRMMKSKTDRNDETSKRGWLRNGREIALDGSRKGAFKITSNLHVGM